MVAASHPHFMSPLQWHTRLADALAAAGDEGLKVLLVHGRAGCPASRVLVERTLAKAELVEFVNENFVVLYSDADAVEAEVAALARSAPGANTPICLALATDGRVLSATAGARPPAVLLNDLLGALSRAAPA